MQNNLRRSHTAGEGDFRFCWEHTLKGKFFLNMEKAYPQVYFEVIGLGMSVACVSCSEVSFNFFRLFVHNAAVFGHIFVKNHLNFLPSYLSLPRKHCIRGADSMLDEILSFQRPGFSKQTFFVRPGCASRTGIPQNLTNFFLRGGWRGGRERRPLDKNSDGI